MTDTGQKLRLHIAALSSQPDVFWVTEERFANACSRYPELASRLEADWSWDLVGFDKAVRISDIVIGWRFGDLSLIRNAKRLKWIQLTGAGTDHLQPLDWLPRRIRLTNNTGVHGPKLAEFVGTSILMLNHGFPHYVTQQRHSKWSKQFTTTINGKSVLIIGLGSSGSAVAKWLKTKLGLKVVGVRRSGQPHRYADSVFPPDQIDRLLPQADFVVVTAPLTNETNNLLNRRRLSLLKPTAGLVNLGRAKIIDYEALAEYLEEGRIAGAILDVFDPEPLPPTSPLWHARNLIAVPHCSSDDAEHYIDHTLDLFFDNFARLVQGKRLNNNISRRLQY